ncbi:MAG: hypothetical protein QNJ36_09085 [Calothrix sp. MO_167.B42]|nr:hypothetical protein [Calothrix sp. MO_167.B42]
MSTPRKAALAEAADEIEQLLQQLETFILGRAEDNLPLLYLANHYMQYLCVHNSCTARIMDIYLAKSSAIVC